MAKNDHGGVMMKSILLIAVFALQVGCAGTQQPVAASQDVPMITFEQISSEITVTHVALHIESRAEARVAVN